MTLLMKIIQKYYYLFFSLILMQSIIIKSENLCPFNDPEDLIKYYVKGVIPNYNDTSSNIKDFKWEFIHCINGYSLSTYMMSEFDDIFFKNTGIFIGSSIDLGKLSKDFINNNLSSLDYNTREKLLSVSGKLGEEAAELYNTTGYFTLTDKEVDIINQAVYSYFLTEMKIYFINEKLKSYTLEICLLTFFAKFFGLSHYLEEARYYVVNEQYYMLSFYFLNIKNNNYFQSKIWTLLALSSTTINYNYHHIGFYLDSKTEQVSNQENIRQWIQRYISLFTNRYNLYTIGNITDIILSEDNNQIYDASNFMTILDNYQFSYYKYENINEGIKKFRKILEYNNTLFRGNYYQRHLIIFLNGKQEWPYIERLNLKKFYKSGINVILMFKTTNKNEYQQMASIIDDKFNLIPFYYYDDLIKDDNYSLILNSQVNFYIESFNYDEDIIEINKIKMIKKDNIQCFKITYDDLINKNKININNNLSNSNIFYYFHISLIYNNAREIRDKYKNNANVTFFISNKNPYTDIHNFYLINYCFNNTVSSDFNKSPFINYIISSKYLYDNYFYITIVGNDLDYSLRIELLSDTDYDNFNVSNGLFGNLQVWPNSSESIATFSEERCIQKSCNVDFFSLMKYYTSGLHLNSDNDDVDLFNKIFDKNMFECLYKNYYCPFFIIDQKETIYNDGPYLGYGIDLPQYTENNLFKEFTPLYIINKLFPFLLNNFNSNLAKETLEKNNVILTYEELYQLNINYLREILQQTQRLKNFDSFSQNIKLSLFLRATELGSASSIKYLDELNNKQYNKYLDALMKSELTRTTSFESLNFQMLLIQATIINKLQKCLVSIIVGKSLLWSEVLIELIKKFENYRISISYYDDDKNEAIMAQYFTEEITEITNNINSIIKDKKVEKMKSNVDINSLLKQQYSLLKYFDYGIKKCVIIVSTHTNDTFIYNFNKPEKELLENLYDLGVNIFDYSDKINFFGDNFNETDTKNKNSYNFFNAERNEYIQYVPYLEYFDIADNYLTLKNMVNKYPIPINKIQGIYLDLNKDEEIIFEFNLEKEKKNLNNGMLSIYNKLKFSFGLSALEIYISRKCPFPNNYSYELNYTFDNNDEYNDITYDLKDIYQDSSNSKFYMMVKTSEIVVNSFVDIQLCNNEGICMKESFYFKFYLGFTAVGILIFLYGIYICFCEITFKKESNIFDIK